MPRNKTPLLISASVIAAGLLGGGYWWLVRESGRHSPPPVGKLPAPPSVALADTFPPPAAVSRGTVVRIEGSPNTSAIDRALKIAFEREFPGAEVAVEAGSSDGGLEALAEGKIDIAALSRPLTPGEQSQGLVAVPVSQDAGGRTLYYAYRQPASPQVRAFLGYGTSPEGQQAISAREETGGKPF